ncbi:MAG: transcription antitermination factor NusB [Rickettsiales bacterium]
MSTHDVGGDSRRRRARLAALHYLYAAEMQNHAFKPHELRAGILEYWRDELPVPPAAGIDLAFFDALVAGCYVARADLDEMIALYLASNWKLSRIDILMRDLLRLGVFELAVRKDVSFATILDEYIDVAKCYFNDAEAAFVNGLLDNVAKALRAEEKEARAAAMRIALAAQAEEEK